MHADKIIIRLISCLCVSCFWKDSESGTTRTKYTGAFC